MRDDRDPAAPTVLKSAATLYRYTQRALLGTSQKHCKHGLGAKYGLCLRVQNAQPRGRGPQTFMVRGSMHAMARDGYDAGIMYDT